MQSAQFAAGSTNFFNTRASRPTAINRTASSAAKPPVSPLGMTAVTEQKITVARIEKAVQLLWRTRFSNRLPRAVTRGTHWNWNNGPWSSEKSYDHFVEGAE